MSKYAIEDTTLTAIGDAIRGKEGSTEPIVVADFADRIAAISGGGGDTPGGGGDIDLSISIKEQMINEVGEVWVNRIHSYLDTVSQYYAAVVIEVYGQEGDNAFPSGNFAISSSSLSPKILNLNTLEPTDIAFDENLVITAGDYMEEISTGVWRMIVSLYNSSSSSSKSLFAGTYNWSEDMKIPYLCANGNHGSSSGSMYQFVTYNSTYGSDVGCYEIRNMSYQYRNSFYAHGNKYMILKYDSSKYSSQASSPALYKMYGYNSKTADFMCPEYISVDGLYMSGDSSSYGKYAYFFQKSPHIKRISFNNCKLYAYFTLGFYLYNSYADFSGSSFEHASYLNTFPQNGVKFYFAKGNDWQERLKYFAEHMPESPKTIPIDLPQFVNTKWGIENVISVLTEKGYTVTTTLSAYNE